ncbi:DUF6282 family protein [Pseudolysinimonas kribbensis]|uniref:DUF6282 family protein n=1 Tax=Pseudolysinimonas kribbensis TaxID=433641 RepID=UPI0031DCA908
METHPTPSARAREIVAGAYDTHVHVAPDVVPRVIDDLTLAYRFLAVGMKGFVLKSHYVQTGERAAVVRRAVPGVDALGALCLNVPVGGLNPVAVEIAARSGARIVWFPTMDSVNQRATVGEIPAGAKPPMWLALMEELKAEGIDPDPVLVVDDRGDLLPAAHDVLTLIAKHDLTLATGHLSASEIMTLVPAAAAAGVRRIIVTHPEFPSQRLAVEQQLELAAHGALMERCYTTPATGKIPWDEMIEHIVAVGAEHSILSSDLGQPTNPPVEDGLALMADDLIARGISEDDVHTMAVTNSVRLMTPSTAPVGAVR